MTRRQRRLPTKHELGVWRGYIETAEAVRSKLADRLQADFGLSSGDYQVLVTLSEAPDNRLRSTELAFKMGWEKSRLSHHLSRMERRNLVSRQDCADDNRGAWIVHTREGEQAFQNSTVPHLMAIREIFVEALSPEEIDQIDALTRKLRSKLEGTNSGSRTRPSDAPGYA
ncbi:MAG TPA: MarR family transcriptional regulator [Devosia sp.]|jgi:DNA-binding MarR family transcriptional regulator|nr:MarR family transcriptional regulator [Devosia sp.]